VSNDSRPYLLPDAGALVTRLTDIAGRDQYGRIACTGTACKLYCIQLEVNEVLLMLVLRDRAS